MKSFGEIIRDARFRKKIGQRELSEKTGICPVTIGNYERGITIPSLGMAIKIMKVLDVDVEKYLNECCGKGEKYEY